MLGESVKTLRNKLGLSQEEFSSRYRIPIAALRNWEQNRRNPDPTAQAFLHIIEAILDDVARILDENVSS